MVKISACVITKNEEAHIEHWLRTMRKITKDLIVVDTGSSDRTVELAQAGSARVYHFEWIDDFAAAKNYAIEQAKGDWILFLDADEYFTEASLPHVRKLIEKHHRNRKIEVFLCKMIDVDTDRDNALLSEFYNVRIFRNVPWLRYEDKVHEMLRKSNGKMNLTVVPDSIEILHTGYTQSIVTKKLKRNLAILQQEIAQDGEKPKHYRFLSDCYYGLDQYELALKYARLHIASDWQSIGRDNTMQKRIIDCLDLMQAGEKKVMAEIDAQIAAYPDDPEFLWYKGEYLARLGQHAQAEVYFARMFALQEQQKAAVLDISRFEARKMRVFVRLAEIAAKKGDFASAEASYRQAVRQQKYNETLFVRWYRWLRQKDPVEAVGALREIYGKTERELLFVYKQLQRFPQSKVHIYYRRLIKETLDMQVVTTATADLFGAGRCWEAAVALGEAMEEEYACLLLCTVLGESDQSMREAQFLLPEGQRRALCALRGQTVSLTLEEETLCDSVRERIAACRGDLQRPIEALRARYRGMRRQAQPTADEMEDVMRLLRLAVPGDEPQCVLAIDCDGLVLARLRALWPQATLREVSAEALPEAEEGVFHWSVLGKRLNAYSKPLLLLQALYRLLTTDGFLLCSANQAADGQTSDETNGRVFLTLEALMDCVRTTKFSDVMVDVEERETIGTPHLRARYWHVRLGKMSAATHALRRALTPEDRRELVFLLRRVENDIDALGNMRAVRRFCEENKVEAPYLAALIDNSMIRKTKLFVQLATFFFEQGAQQTAIRLLIAALKAHAQEAEFICALALLLQLSGARQEARKVLMQFRGEDVQVQALRKELTT